MANVYKVYKDLPPWAKGVVVIGVGLVAFMVGKRIYSNLFPTADQRKNQQLTKDIENEIRDAEHKGLRPSFKDSVYLTIANTIYEGMRYCVGDNYSAVEDNMKKMQNDLDVAKLIKAFGTRQAYCFGLDSGSPKDLFSFVNSELGADYGGLTNYRVRSINADWAKKGITYKL